MREKLLNIINNVTEGVYSQESLFNDDYVEKEMMDSLQIVELVVELENEFNIVIEDEDLSVENMKSFETIIELIQRLRK